MAERDPINGQPRTAAGKRHAEWVMSLWEEGARQPDFRGDPAVLRETAERVVREDILAIEAEAVASVPAPEQEEAVRLREAILGIVQEIQTTQAVDEMPHIPLNVEAAIITARDLALATPPPVPAAPAALWRSSKKAPGA